MENNGEEVNKLGPKETSPNEKPRSELYGIPQEGNLKSMEDANGGLCSKVHKNCLIFLKFIKSIHCHIHIYSNLFVLQSQFWYRLVDQKFGF